MPRFVLPALAALAFSAGHSSAATPVILISVDTLRADHLSCYHGKVPTPHIDSLAANGTVFTQINTPFPLTLPAHTALFTSTYPFANGVRDNGVPLGPDAVTLAMILKQAGYRTGAFVGSFVLDRRFGLSRGFDVYDSPSDLHNKTAVGVGERKRPGEQVVAAASHWLDLNSGAPFFLFLHLYDLHAPYDLPADSDKRHGETGYAAELAYVDRVLGDFFNALEHRGLRDKALIVFTSDHGEGLGEHGESSHGYFVYESTLHVPLIVHWPSASRRIAAARVEEPASLLDVAPTILDVAGIPLPPGMKGRSLAAARGAEDVYSESTYARNHFGCATLRSVRSGNFHYIDAPRPELYDLTADPGELTNLYAQQRAKAVALAERIAAMRATASAGSAKQVTPTPETSSVLRSLGYLSGSSSRVESHVDPKDRSADFERYLNALGLASAGQARESDVVLERLRDKMPELVDIRTSLGLNEQKLGDDAQAARDFKRAVELDPSNAAAHFDLGSCYFRLRQRDQAIQQMKAALAIEPWYTRADEALADLYIQGKDFPNARTHLNHILSIDPGSYTAHFNLGIMAAMEQNWSAAGEHMLAAVRADPGSAEAHNTLGGIYLQRGELEPAARQLEEAIRLQPKLSAAHYALSLVYQQQGKTAQAAEQMRAAQESKR